MPVTSDDRELRRTTRGGGSIGQRTSQTSVQSSPSVTTRAKDTAKPPTSESSASAAVSESTSKGSDSTLGSSSSEGTKPKDNDKMDIDTVARPKPTGETDKQQATAKQGGADTQSAKQNGQEDKAKEGPLVEESATSDKRRRTSQAQENGQWRDEALKNSNATADDDAHARKKRRVDATQQQSATTSTSERTVPSNTGTPQTLASSQNPPPPPNTQASKLTRSPQAIKVTPSTQPTRAAPVGQAPRPPQPGQPGQAPRPQQQGPPGQGPRPPQQGQPRPVQIRRPSQPGHVAQSSQPTRQTVQPSSSSQPPRPPRPPQNPQVHPPQPRQPAAAATSAEDVVIVDVDPVPPSPKKTLVKPPVPMPPVPLSAAALAADRSRKLMKRPPPLAGVPPGSTGNPTHYPPVQSARSATSSSNIEVQDGLQSGLSSGVSNVSPVVSGFPMHTADKATLESFKYALQIKDQQRELIQKRREGKLPSTMDSPGIGPPPSAGPIPPMMYLHRNSVGNRRSEAVKQKVQGMRVSTGTEGYSRQNGMRTAPVGHPQQPPQGVHPSSMRTTAHGVDDDGYDDDDPMHDDPQNQHQPVPLRGEGPSAYASQQHVAPGHPRYPPQSAHPSAAGHPSAHPGPRYAKGSEAAYESHRRMSINGYMQPGGTPGVRPPPSGQGRSPPTYPPGSAYGQQTSPYQRSAKPMEYPQTARSTSYNRPPPQHAIAGPPTAGRGEYPPGTMYPPRPPSGYPGPGVPPSASAPVFRPRSPGRAPPGPAPVEVNKDHFMEPFHLLFDTFMDSMQLKRDLESKIRRANDLVEAQEAELRRISGLRIEFERSLDRLQRSQERLGQRTSSGHGGNGMEISPPASGGSNVQPRAPTVPLRGNTSDREHEDDETGGKVQHTEK